VRLSSEGTFYQMHDSTVDRTTDGTGALSSKTDAQIDALAIDGGYGYDAGRHGTSLNVPSLAACLDALAPYDCTIKIQLNDSAEANATQLAEEVVATGLSQRCILEVDTVAEAAAVKAVDASLVTMVNVTVSGADSSDDVDWLSVADSSVTNLAYSTGKAPQKVGAYMSIVDYGNDESSEFQDMWDYGAASFQTNDVDAALTLRKALLYGGSGSGGGAPTDATYIVGSADGTLSAEVVKQYLADNEDPDAYPGSPDAMDDEFEGGGSIDGKWAVTNDPAGTGVSQSRIDGFLHFVVPEGSDNGTFDNSVRVAQTAPIGTATMEFVAKVAVTMSADGQYHAEWGGVELYLGNSTDDEWVGVGVQLNDNAPTFPLNIYASEETFTGVSGGKTVGGIPPGSFVYLKLAKTTANAYTSANTYAMYMSSTGIVWQWLGSISKAFTSLCDEVGFISRKPRPGSGDPTVDVVVDFFRKTA